MMKLHSEFSYSDVGASNEGLQYQENSYQSEAIHKLLLYKLIQHGKKVDTFTIRDSCTIACFELLFDYYLPEGSSLNYRLQSLKTILRSRKLIGFIECEIVENNPIQLNVFLIDTMQKKCYSIRAKQ
jgi:hypothetical protein